MERFIALFDAHWGYQHKGGHKIPLHDQKALNVALAFMKDFAPDHVVLGGDLLDCSSVSHHNHGKPGAVEGFRLLADAKELRKALIEPIEALKTKSLVYIIGNHEDWCNDLVEQIPALEGIVDIGALLSLNKRWKVVPNGEAHKLKKLVFVHGDQIKGGVHAAKYAVDTYQRNIFFGHFHTHQTFTNASALDMNGHTGTAVPCLCKKNPNYGGGSPNRWLQGFVYGYLNDDGSFNAYVPIIINGRATINGKAYHG